MSTKQMANTSTKKRSGLLIIGRNKTYNEVSFFSLENIQNFKIDHHTLQRSDFWNMEPSSDE